MIKIHELKTDREMFEAVVIGIKTAEYRVCDRPFNIRDYLLLNEWDSKAKEYTGRQQLVKVTHIVRAPAYGIPQGYCLMSITTVNLL